MQRQVEQLPVQQVFRDDKSRKALYELVAVGAHIRAIRLRGKQPCIRSGLAQQRLIRRAARESHVASAGHPVAADRQQVAVGPHAAAREPVGHRHDVVPSRRLRAHDHPSRVWPQCQELALPTGHIHQSRLYSHD